MQDKAKQEMTQMYGLRNCGVLIHIVHFRIDAHCEKCAVCNQYTVMYKAVYFQHKNCVCVVLW